jgi:hypothetical protein
MGWIINNGSGDVEIGDWDIAYENIQQFIKDCEIKMHVKSSEFEPNDSGRYVFVLSADEYIYETEIEMPALPLDKVRFMKEEGQNIWDFPRLYVDGGSWVWLYGIIKKEHLIEQLENKIGEYQELIESCKEDITKLKSE